MLTSCAEGSKESFGGCREEEKVHRKEIRQWKRGELLGRGAFGAVYLGMNLQSGEFFAVKLIEELDDSQAGKQELNALDNEIATLQNCKHENIVQYLGCQRTEHSLAIFLEYVPGGSISDILAKFQGLNESIVRAYTRQLLLGLEYLHLKGVAHRDIKGANLLVTTAGIVKLADFGASKMLWSTSSKSARYSNINYGVQGTALWMAPEVIREDQPEKAWKKADMWSVGCTVVEMFTGKPPWSQFTNAVAAMYHIACGKHSPTIPSKISEDGKAFLRVCFRQDPVTRPDASTILLHRFLTSSLNERKSRRNLPSPSLKENDRMRGEKSLQFTFFEKMKAEAESEKRERRRSREEKFKDSSKEKEEDDERVEVHLPSSFQITSPANAKRNKKKNEKKGRSLKAQQHKKLINAKQSRRLPSLEIGIKRNEPIRVICDPFEMVKDAMNSLRLKNTTPLPSLNHGLSHGNHHAFEEEKMQFETRKSMSLDSAGRRIILDDEISRASRFKGKSSKSMTCLQGNKFQSIE